MTVMTVLLVPLLLATCSGTDSTSCQQEGYSHDSHRITDVRSMPMSMDGHDGGNRNMRDVAPIDQASLPNQEPVVDLMGNEDEEVHSSFKRKRKEDVVPNEFVCSITQEVMTDPVSTSDGHCYERNAILKCRLSDHD